MSIMAECPVCHQKQSVRHKRCRCGENLDKAKRNGQLRYYIKYTLDKKQRVEYVGKSFEEARAAEGKRLGQKREGRIFEMTPDAKLTFEDITGWYLELSSVKKLASYPRVNIALNNFNAVFGRRVAGTVLPIDLEEYQAERTRDGISPATIDVELNIVRGMISKAFDNDKLDGRTLKAFRRVKNLIKRGGNARGRVVSIDEYRKLLAVAPKHFHGMLVIAHEHRHAPGRAHGACSGISSIGKPASFAFLLPSRKKRREKVIPINHHVREVLDGQLRHLDHDRVFTFGGEPIEGPKACKGALEGSCKRAGLPYGRKAEGGITMHDFRRTVKTNMLEAGVDKTYRDLILGHSLEGMDRHYIKPSNDTLRQAMALYTAWLDGQLAKSDQNSDQVQNAAV